MKSIVNIKLLLILLLPVSIWASVEYEVLILFKPDIIQIPAGKDSVNLSEIIAPQEILTCFQEIEVQEIKKVVPKFRSEDTVKINEDGSIARLPDFSQLFLLKLSCTINRDSAIVILKNLDQVFCFSVHWTNCI